MGHLDETDLEILPLLMSLSTVIVAINAQFLRRADLDIPRLPEVSLPAETRPTG